MPEEVLTDPSFAFCLYWWLGVWLSVIAVTAAVRAWKGRRK